MPISPADVALLLEAIDSHIYWQLADSHYRNNGDVTEPGADDPEQQALIAKYRELAERLGGTDFPLRDAVDPVPR